MDSFEVSVAIKRTLRGKGFEQDLEATFRDLHRSRFRYPRAGLFLILALIFYVSQLNGGFLFAADAVSYPLLHSLSVHIAVPVSALAFLVLLFNCPRKITRPTEAAATFAAAACTVYLRKAALDGHLDYPSQLIGLIIVAFAVFGGYSWKPVAAGTALFASAAIWSELKLNSGGAPNIIDIYCISIMAMIAVAGAFTHDVLARLAWLHNRHARHLARTDTLTGLSSRREFNRSFPRLIAQAHRDQRMVAVMLLDLDHFKKINDDNGHLAGDEVLRALGKVLLNSVARRPLDMRVRYGGEEVLVVWYDVDEDTTRQLAESTLQLIRNMRIPVPDRSDRLRVTASAGVTWLTPADSATPTEILNRSDELLYAAKARGRNCAMIEAFEPAAV